jgi:hypothetical protein
VRAPSSEDLERAARAIERWLLTSGVQLAGGPHRGGVAGWLDAGGRPEFVYLEITGYYLTAMAWLIGGGARASEGAAVARERGRAALEWLGTALADGAVPPTRLHLDAGREDWRNAATFSFDLAMAARGAACLGAAVGTEAADPLVAAIAARVDEIRAGGAELVSHAPREGSGARLPDRWSTRPGPHHVKAAAALLGLGPGALDPGLERACRATAARGAESLRTSWPCRELHPLLYGLEGLTMLGPDTSDDLLDLVEGAYERLLELQRPDGALPARALPEARGVRSDVLAQALRVGALLRAAGRLAGAAWGERLGGLTAALLRHVRPDGGVLFSVDQHRANAWCAMFAQQALVLQLSADCGARIAPLATELLV